MPTEHAGWPHSRPITCGPFHRSCPGAPHPPGTGSQPDHLSKARYTLRAPGLRLPLHLSTWTSWLPPPLPGPGIPWLCGPQADTQAEAQCFCYSAGPGGGGGRWGGGEGLQPVQAASQSSGAPTLSGLGVGGKGSTSPQSRPIHLVRGIVLP